jgi:hypothetical protein
MQPLESGPKIRPTGEGDCPHRAVGSYFGVAFSSTVFRK